MSISMNSFITGEAHVTSKPCTTAAQACQPLCEPHSLTVAVGCVQAAATLPLARTCVLPEPLTCAATA
jgi:hypothetical protein